jgi:DNA helicase-2/ATP-dependent DNA helicase PcrA
VAGQLVRTRDPFADVGEAPAAAPAGSAPRGSTKNPGGSFTARTFTREPARVLESHASAVSFGAKPRDDLSVGLRVFHQKFGYGVIAEIEGNKLEIDFEVGGRKRCYG